MIDDRPKPAEPVYRYKWNKRKNTYGEYVIRCYRDGKRFPDGDYHTDDRRDAEVSFEMMKNGVGQLE
jgi:hypothetical protein